MDRFVGSTALYAMHPEYLSALLQREAIEAKLPEPLQAFAAMMTGGTREAKAPDPIREGATVILPVNGFLAPRAMYSGTSTEWLADKVREFAADPKVGAIILKVSSPGGIVWGTQEAGDAIYEARQAKPIVAVATPYSFSAAHWLATQASAYYASPSAEVGSVGVRGGHVDQSGFEEKIGFKTTLIASHPDKIAAHPYAPLSDEDRETLQAEIDEMNEVFVSAIARGRGIKASEVPSVHGQGKTFSARRAAEAGTIDGVMTLREVVAKYGSSRARLDLMRRRAALQQQIASI